jgi:hypothetical protein
MSYKVKSLIYLICFIASVLIYGQMETSMEGSNPEKDQLVQTQMDDH